MRSRPSQHDANVRWYAAHREQEIARVRSRQAATLEFLRAIRDVPCRDCGRRFQPCQMDFDHRDPAQKRFALSTMQLKSRDELVAEAANCDVVCANCHSLRTRRQHRERLAGRGRSTASSRGIDQARSRWRWHADILDQLRDVPCLDCGCRFAPCAMEFDHRDPRTKVSAVTQMVGRASIERILVEVDKCDIVCRNCHRLRTYERRCRS